MPTKATIRQARYDEKNCVNYHLKLVRNTDGDIIDKLATLPSKQGYIKQLIRADMASENGRTVTIQFSDAALAVLREKAAETGKTVEGLIVATVLENLIRI